MKVISHISDNSNIEVIEVRGNLTDSAALEFEKYLYNCLDNGKYYIIINFKDVQEIDNHMINILGDFGSKDAQIRLFNVGEEVQWMIRRSGRFDVLRKIYDITDSVKAVSLFENEVLKKRRFKKGSVNKRRYPRSSNIIVPAEFNYDPRQNRMISGLLNFLNISEGGALVGQIIVKNRLTDRTFIPSQIVGQKLYGVKFRLTENHNIIETAVECIREYNIDEKLYAGLIFLDLNEEDKESIRDFVSSYYDLGRL